MKYYGFTLKIAKRSQRCSNFAAFIAVLELVNLLRMVL